MKQAYTIVQGVVTNTVMLEDGANPVDFGAVAGPSDACIGWSFTDGVWAPPEQPPAPQPPVPPLTARQLRLGLLKIGIKPSQVDAAINALPEDQREAAEIEWAYASEYQRDHYLIGLLATSFGLTEAQVDAAWKDAETL